MIFQRIPPLFIFILLPNLFASVNSQICQNNGNYTANSTYSANLQTALSSVSTNINNNGFYNVSVGQNPDRANVIVLCRGDIQLDMCRDCVQTVSSDLRQSCPYQKQAVHWPEFCMLRYSNESMLGKLETSPRSYWLNPFNATSPNQFAVDLRTLLDKLRGMAASGDSLRKVAAGNVTGPDFQSIYGMVQCTPDLSPDDCSSCLEQAAADIPISCDGRRGCRVNTPSCTLRFEIYGFYSESRLQELAPPPPPPPATASVPNRPPILSPPGFKNHNNAKRNVIIIVVTIILCLSLVGCGIIFKRKGVKQRPHEILESSIEDIYTIESHQYDFDVIRVATNDFSYINQLGQGEFGVVYKGKLQNGQEIAVKRLSRNSRQGNVEFKNEVLLLLKLQHKNLVKLLGFSIQRTERLLIYEFVPNSSLDKFIFDPTKPSYLDWDRSYMIIVGIAKGLLYLQDDSRLTIIHRDLKAGNILLDNEMNPKIADFGMARLFEQNETQGNTDRIVGTYGYMAPEYAMHGQFSSKSDVFSFGVLVLEILTGQKNTCVQNVDNIENLLSFVWKNWSQGKAEDTIDPILKANKDSVQDMVRCIHMGLLCVQENAIDRPTMPSIALMLSSVTVISSLPKEPACFGDNPFGPISLKNTNATHGDSSVNFMSITEFHPRCSLEIMFLKADIPRDLMMISAK